VGDDHRHERIRCPGPTADHLLGTRAVTVLLALGKSLLPGGAVDPGLHVGDGVEPVDDHPVGLHGRRWIDLCTQEARVGGGRGIQLPLPGLEGLLRAGMHLLADDDRRRDIGLIPGVHVLDIHTLEIHGVLSATQVAAT